MYSNQPKAIERSPKDILKTMRIIHIALFIGQLLFAAVIFNTEDKSFFFDIKNDSRDVIFYIVPLFAIGCIIASKVVFKHKINKSFDHNMLSEKLTSYQSAFISRSALLEGPSLLGIAFFSATQNLLYLLISACIMLYFLTLRPTSDKIANDLQLSYDEKVELEA